MLSIFAYLAIATTASVIEQAPILEPGDKWHVDYGASSCMLARQFGTGPGRILVGWRATPFATNYEVSINEPDNGPGQYYRPLTAGVEGGAPATIETWSTGAEAGYRVTQFALDTRLFDAVGESGVLDISRPGVVARRVRITGFKRALKALAACNDDTAKQWGIDPAERDRVAVDATPLGSADRWFRVEDFPSEALNQKRSGSVVALWEIGIDGRVHGCRVVVSSEVPSLDKTTCASITERG